MREGNRAVARWPPRHFRLASPATALVLGVLTLALIAAEWPFAGLAHLGVNANTGGPQWWVYAPFAVVGFVVAWRKPGNPLGWCLVGLALAGALSEDGSLYAIAGYRIRHGTLPLGWVAMLAQPAWAIGIVLIGVAVVLFPDGRPASPLLRRVLWLYLALALVWMGSAYVITLLALVVVGWSTGTFFAGANSAIQHRVTDEVRGRVVSVYSMIFAGTGPVGGLLTAGLARAGGPALALAVGGGICAAAGLLIALPFRHALRGEAARHPAPAERRAG